MDFSDHTRWSGFVPWHARAKFERIAIAEQNGGTSLDWPTFRSALGHGPRSIVLFLTDGALSVSRGSQADVIALLKQHATYVIAAGGDLSCFCKAAAEAGITTLRLADIADVGRVFSAIVTPRLP
jgi:hypothetical protein